MRLEHPVAEPAALLPVDFATVHLDCQAVRLGGAKELVAGRPCDHVLLTLRSALQPEYIGEALHAVGLGLRGLGVRFARLGDGFGTYYIFRSYEREEVAEFRRINNYGWNEPKRGSCFEVDSRNRHDAIVPHFGRSCFGAQMHREPARFDSGPSRAIILSNFPAALLPPKAYLPSTFLTLRLFGTVYVDSPVVASSSQA